MAWEKFKLKCKQAVMQNLLSLKTDIGVKVLKLKEKFSRIDQLLPVDVTKKSSQNRQLKIRRKKENKRKAITTVQ